MVDLTCRVFVADFTFHVDKMGNSERKNQSKFSFGSWIEGSPLFHFTKLKTILQLKSRLHSYTLRFLDPIIYIRSDWILTDLALGVNLPGKPGNCQDWMGYVDENILPRLVSYHLHILRHWPQLVIFYFLLHTFDLFLLFYQQFNVVSTLLQKNPIGLLDIVTSLIKRAFIPSYNFTNSD